MRDTRMRDAHNRVVNKHELAPFQAETPLIYGHLAPEKFCCSTNCVCLVGYDNVDNTLVPSPVCGPGIGRVPV